MTFLLQKCSVLHVTRPRSPLVSQYQLTVLTECTTKFFPVDLQFNLSQRNHISRITKKAHNMLGFLRRTLSQGSEETKIKAYFTMVQSNLDYCCAIWSPYKPDLKHMVEMARRRAPCFVTKRYRNTNTVTGMLNHLKRETHKI